MADRAKMSVEEILATCHKLDGGGEALAPEPADQGQEGAAASAAPAPTKANPSPKKPGSMSVEEMLAAARAEKSGPAGGQSQAPPAAEPSVAKSSAAGKKPGEMSVAEMLAAARAEKAGGDVKTQPAAKAKPAGKPTAAATTAKASPQAPAATKPAGPRDTSSILAAARKSVKPGPMSKAEAAAQGKQVPTKARGKPKLDVPPMPARPGYAKPTPAKQSQDRRGFMSIFLGSFLAIGFTTLALTNLLWTLGFARFMFPNILIEPPSRFKVGFPGDFAAGTVTTKFKAQFGIWVVNAEYDGQLQLVALKSVCTHLGCTPNWLEAEQKFKCPCHGSGFYKDGVNFEGPAPRPLERYAIQVADDGQVEIDKSRVFQEEMGQWRDAASFVPV